MVTQSRVLTPKQVGEFLQLPGKQCYDVIRRLPSSAKFKLGKRLRIWEAGLLDWLQSQEAR